jgi:hypothetical protein
MGELQSISKIMKKIIVSTTVAPVTTALEKFDNMPGWELIVVGDLKTPKDYKINGYYFSPKEQESYNRELSDAMGWNCIQRRNFGFMLAYDMGADIVAVVDDDNIPLDNWGIDVRVGQPTTARSYTTDLIAFDSVGLTNHSNLWHRGFPLELLPYRDYSNYQSISFVPDVQADFWNGDPDIDAVCRMQFRPVCDFDDKYFPFTTNAFTPYNSQNTFLNRHVLKDFFLFPFIGRMDDIWASYYTQAVGKKVLFNRPSVFQDRNLHDQILDMKQEYIGYENNLKLLNDLAISADNILKYLPSKSIHAFKLYQQHFNSHGDLL